jgi:sulfotransferase
MFVHDFNNIKFDVAEFDQRAGTPGLHTIRPKVQEYKRNTILPPDIFSRFEKDAFWRNQDAVKNFKVRIV